MNDAGTEPELITMSGPRTENWGVRRGGKKVMLVVPALEEHLHPEMKSAIDQWRRSTIHGVCDCGGRMVVPAPGVASMLHEAACPVEPTNLLALAKKHNYSWTPGK